MLLSLFNTIPFISPKAYPVTVPAAMFERLNEVLTYFFICLLLLCILNFFLAVRDFQLRRQLDKLFEEGKL